MDPQAQGEAGAQTQEQVTDGISADSGEPDTTTPGNAVRANVIHGSGIFAASEFTAASRLLAAG